MKIIQRFKGYCLNTHFVPNNSDLTPCNYCVCCTPSAAELFVSIFHSFEAGMTSTISSFK